MENQQQTISFFGTVGAGLNLTLVSQRISLPFRTKKIRASFAPGVNRLMRLYFFISLDPEAPTLTPPQGVDILKAIGQVTYITGDEEFKEVPHEVLNISRGAYIKVYAVNADAFEHTIDCQVTIEFIPEQHDTEAEKVG